MLKSKPENKNRALPQILKTLQTRISEGLYLPGDLLPTERDLASEFDIDRSTVRSALIRLEGTGLIVRERGRRPRVSHPVREGVGGVGERVRNTSTRTIAVVLPQHEADHASREILRGITDILRSQETGYRVMIFDTNLRAAPRRILEQEARAAVEEEGIAGAIVWSTLEEGLAAEWLQVSERGHRVIFVDRYDTDVPGDFVGVDNYAAAREAIEYLLERGHRRIVHLTNDEPVSSVMDRAMGYRDALGTAGIVGDATKLWIIPNGEALHRLEDFVNTCLQDPNPPTAVFVVNDFLAHHLIALLELKGVRVPQDISVIGFDDEDRYSPRPALLTSVRQPFERIGQRAAMLLLHRLAQANPATASHQHILLPTSLIERRTCRALKEISSESEPAYGERHRA